MDLVKARIQTVLQQTTVIGQIFNSIYVNKLLVLVTVTEKHFGIYIRFAERLVKRSFHGCFFNFDFYQVVKIRCHC